MLTTEIYIIQRWLDDIVAILVAIVPNQAQKAGNLVAKSAEVAGKSGKDLTICSQKCGKTGKYKEETSNSSGIRKTVSTGTNAAQNQR